MIPTIIFIIIVKVIGLWLIAMAIFFLGYYWHKVTGKDYIEKRKCQHRKLICVKCGMTVVNLKEANIE